MLGVGDTFPEFKVKATVSTSRNLSEAFTDIDQDTYAGKWKIYFFYPKDFTFVCPTEIKGFNDLQPEFEKRNAQVIAASTDSEFVHHAWRTHDKLINDLSIPMLADIKRELSASLGILDAEEGVAQRASFIVDPDNKIRSVYVTDLNVGRNPQEVLRILTALQTDKLCPCAWEEGKDTLS